MGYYTQLFFCGQKRLASTEVEWNTLDISPSREIFVKLEVMKILSLRAAAPTDTSHQFTSSDLHGSTPFGYDLLLVNPSSSQHLYGSNSHATINSRWQDAIAKWSNGKRKVIIFMDRVDSNTLHWLPIDQDTRTTLAGLQSVGVSDYIGNISSTDPILRHFITEHKPHFIVNTYLKYEATNPHITVHSGVDESLVTSFTYKKDLVEIVFLPTLPMANLIGYINTLDQPANSWGVASAEEINSKISAIDGQINELFTSRDELNRELSSLNDSISSTIESDIYLTRAIGHYDATKSTEHPSPESFYGAVEAIENAFNSEREMREKLGLTKAYIDKVMRRANEFRHEAKNGQPPTPLTAEEVSDLSSRVSKVISAYIQYLLND